MTFQEFSKNYSIILMSNGNAISTLFVLPAAVVFPVTLTLNLNDYDCVILSFVSAILPQTSRCFFK